MSIGVSVDSNVVYFEHLKDDVRNGRTIRSAVDRSFHASFRTILKADVASLIGAGLLYLLTVGPVRGFAFFLGLSTVLDLVASYFFMRPVVVPGTAPSCATPARRLGLPRAANRDEPRPGAPAVTVAAAPSGATATTATR